MESSYQNASLRARIINKNISVHVIIAKQNKAEDYLKVYNFATN